MAARGGRRTPLAAIPPAALAQQGGAGRFKANSRSGPITAHRQPLSLLAKERVKVVVTMDVESVAQVRARTPGHVISRQDHDAVHTQVARQHAAVETMIAGRGGRVRAHYRDAMSGMKVEIARGEISGLSNLPGVVQVVGVPKYNIKNVVSVPFIGAPEVWQGIPGFRGEHVKIAIIDTGIDYTHANFGGPGTVAAFAAAAATSTAPADPKLFGPNAPKVKGGTDLVGDDYDADITVVAAAGNAGPAPYINGDPAASTHAISVAAMDARAFLVNGVHIALSSGGGANGVEANDLKLPTGNVPAVILKSGSALSLGCNATDYPASGAAGALVIVSRGTCSFDQKLTNAQAAGAAAIGVVNNAAGFFSPIIDVATIPFIELQRSDTATFLAAPSPVSASVAPANVPDAGFKLAASFSSGGPPSGDGALKPNVSSPPVNVFSTNIGTGTGGTYESGTSMATPHVAGVAALAVQAHKHWKKPGLRPAPVQTPPPPPPPTSP